MHMFRIAGRRLARSAGWHLGSAESRPQRGARVMAHVPLPIAGPSPTAMRRPRLAVRPLPAVVPLAWCVPPASLCIYVQTPGASTKQTPDSRRRHCSRTPGGAAAALIAGGRPSRRARQAASMPMATNCLRCCRARCSWAVPEGFCPRSQRSLASQAPRSSRLRAQDIADGIKRCGSPGAQYRSPPRAPR